MRTITLKSGREAPVRGGHPWIFSGAIASGLDGAEPGEPVRIVRAGGGVVAVAGLTLYDMCKAIDRDMTIGAIRLVEKRGGRSGAYRRAGER